MFAKVFGQIFDSSIAEDYNCRRMFMDLLVLADSDGVVDMTPEAISRRTNVPIEEVQKYIENLCQPDDKSRSQLHEGKRLIPLDSRRDWGWVIVNYKHYREIRDEEARKIYFRDAMRKSRAKKKKEMSLTALTEINKVKPLASASASNSSSFLEELKKDPFNAGVDINAELEKAQRWCKKKGRRCTERFFRKWVERTDRIVPAPVSKPKPLPEEPKPLSPEEIERNKAVLSVQMKELRDKFRMS